jgi:hypothetical protein
MQPSTERPSFDDLRWIMAQISDLAARLSSLERKRRPKRQVSVIVPFLQLVPSERPTDPERGPHVPKEPVA